MTCKAASKEVHLPHAEEALQLSDRPMQLLTATDSPTQVCRIQTVSTVDMSAKVVIIGAGAGGIAAAQALDGVADVTLIDRCLLKLYKPVPC